ncbi:hypothetical protein BDZ94DRAFT_49168 [Collybia nuda]|uniref:DM2 domain-containing protein n=1 Tax=Collybia nuda TaxID=64659 RepID=A0A9P5YLX2_9AGAR|nr:hypothetical protein BDZ94DRAFT_49168 [Collybia nuda]
MSFNFSTLEPHIRTILSAPGTDLATISAKRVRHQLLELDSTLTADFLKENKSDVDVVIASVFEKVSELNGVGGRQYEAKTASRKRKQEEGDAQVGLEEYEDKGIDDEEIIPPPKKAKKTTKTELSDAELARKLSSEINSRSRRTTGGSRVVSNVNLKKSARAKKSAEIIYSDDDADTDEARKLKFKSKRKSTGGGTAKGGFAKEYTLSEPLATLLKIDKLSRPQVVKQLWDYIKSNELQNPKNRREIVCDESLRAVFGVDKIDMFRMNKVLGQHLHESEG